MTIEEFYKEYSNLKLERKKQGLYKLVDLLIIEDVGIRDTPALDALLDISSDLEADDYFGTEGADI